MILNHLNIEYYIPESLEEFIIIINSCKQFICGLSAPLTFALSMHKKCVIINNIDHSHHNNLNNHFSNIVEIL